MNSFFLMIMLVLLQYSLDPTKHDCNTLYSRSILLFHHMISIYIMFGGILFHPLYHALFCIGILIHWYSNNNRCEITIITNRMWYRYCHAVQRLFTNPGYIKTISQYSLVFITTFDTG